MLSCLTHCSPSRQSEQAGIPSHAEIASGELASAKACWASQQDATNKATLSSSVSDKVTVDRIADHKHWHHLCMADEVERWAMEKCEERFSGIELYFFLKETGHPFQRQRARRE